MKRFKYSKVITFFLLFIFAFNFASGTTYAKKGDFYKEYKSQIEAEIKDKDTREFIEKYDYANNKFDCGTFDVMCMINGMQYRAYIGMIKLNYSGLKSAIITPNEITGNDTFKKYKNGFATLSNTMLVIFILWQITKLIAQRYADSDDGLVSINDKLLTTFSAAVLLGIYDQFFVWIINLQAEVVKGIISDTISVKDVVLILFIKGAAYGDLITIILVLAIVLFNIIFMYRFILFGFLYITGVLAIPTMLNDEYNYFSLWLKQLINNGVTLFLQVLAFSVGFNALVKNNAFNSGTSFTVAMGFFMLAIAIPSILGQLGASSGASRGIASAVRYVARRG